MQASASGVLEGGKEEEDRPQVAAGHGRDAERTSHFEERGQQEKG